MTVQRHPFVAAILALIGQTMWARAERAKPLSHRSEFGLPPDVSMAMPSRGYHRKNSSRLGGSVKSHARAAKKARNVRRNRAAHR